MCVCVHVSHRIFGKNVGCNMHVNYMYVHLTTGYAYIHTHATTSVLEKGMLVSLCHVYMCINVPFCAIFY
jgi:hypothetical protein